MPIKYLNKISKVLVPKWLRASLQCMSIKPKKLSTYLTKWPPEDKARLKIIGLSIICFNRLICDDHCDNFLVSLLVSFPPVCRRCSACVSLWRPRLSEPGLPEGPEGGVLVPAARAGAGPAQRPRQGHAGEGGPC